MAGFGAAFAAFIMIIITPIIGGLLTLVAIRLSANQLLNRKEERRFASISKQKILSQSLSRTGSCDESIKLNIEIKKRERITVRIKSELKSIRTDINKVSAELNPYIAYIETDGKTF